MSEETPPSARRPRERHEHLSLAERAELRDQELRAARSAVEAAPDDEDAAERYALAKRACAAGLSSVEMVERECAALDLITTKTTAEAAREFSKRFDVSLGHAYTCLRRATTSERPETETYRALLLLRAEQSWADAREGKQHMAALAALQMCAKLAGLDAVKVDVSSRHEHSGTVKHEHEVPSFLRELLTNPRVQAYQEHHDKMPAGPHVLQLLARGELDPATPCGQRGCACELHQHPAVLAFRLHHSAAPSSLVLESLASGARSPLAACGHDGCSCHARSLPS